MASNIAALPLKFLSIMHQGVNEKDSSVQKGESIKDTTQTLASYCDAIVLRHPMKGAAETAVSVSSIPVINGGKTDSLGYITINCPCHACHSY
jgi:aspartate carbamoyltransferase catalytic subunit